MGQGEPNHFQSLSASKQLNTMKHTASKSFEPNFLYTMCSPQETLEKHKSSH